MQFGHMYEKGTTDAIFNLRRLQEEYHVKGNQLYMRFADLEKAIHRLPRKA